MPSRTRSIRRRARGGTSHHVGAAAQSSLIAVAIQPDDASISADLVGWNKAAGLSGADGDPISTWTGTAPGGNLARTLTLRPTLKTAAAGFNSLSSALFDGVDDNLIGNSGVGWNPAAGLTAFIVFRQAAAAAGFLAGSSLANTTNYGWQTSISALGAVSASFFQSSGATHAGATKSGLGDPNLTHVAIARLTTSTQAKVWVDGGGGATASTSGTVGTGGNAASSNSLGQRTDGGGPPAFAGNIGEVIVYKAALSDANIDKVLKYLETRFNLSGLTNVS